VFGGITNLKIKSLAESEISWKMRTLSFSRNKCSGAARNQFANYGCWGISTKNLAILHLDQNEPKCSLPEDTAASNRMGNPNLSYNTVSGPIPESISQLVSMHALNSSHNLFTGCIQDLTSCSNLSHLQLQHNGFGLWKLLCVSLHNCFCGAIPESIARSGGIYFLILRHNLPAGKSHHTESVTFGSSALSATAWT
ncbi:hypothetical protein HDU77_001289, partial [Chytriomyces hyalinus]